MAKLVSKHANQQNLLMTDFSGGLNLLKAGELIGSTEVQLAENFEMDYVSGAIKTTSGFASVYDAGIIIDTVFPVNDNTFLFTSNRDVYFTDFVTKTHIGTLTGFVRPVYCWFGDDIIIASGGKLQRFFNNELTTITTSRDADFVFVRFGRVVITKRGTDELTYSSIGDCVSAQAWIQNPNDDSTSKYIQIGYKDAGDIVAVVPLMQDLIVFKSNHKIFRVQGHFPDWSVSEVSSNGFCSSFASAIQVQNDVFFLGVRGFCSLSSVVEYGDFQQVDIGVNVNHFLQYNLEPSAKIWYLPLKKQVWILPQQTGTIFIYSLISKSFTTRKMVDPPNDVFYFNNDVFIARGNKILQMRDDIATDDGTLIECNLRTKIYVAPHEFLVKRFVVALQNNIIGNAQATIGRLFMELNTGHSGDLVYNDSEIAYVDSDPIYENLYTETSVRCNFRTSNVEINIRSTGCQFSIRKIQVTIAEV